MSHSQRSGRQHYIFCPQRSSSSSCAEQAPSGAGPARCSSQGRTGATARQKRRPSWRENRRRHRQSWRDNRRRHRQNRRDNRRSWKLNSLRMRRTAISWSWHCSEDEENAFQSADDAVPPIRLTAVAPAQPAGQLCQPPPPVRGRRRAHQGLDLRSRPADAAGRCDHPPTSGSSRRIDARRSPCRNKQHRVCLG